MVQDEPLGRPQVWFSPRAGDAVSAYRRSAWGSSGSHRGRYDASSRRLPALSRALGCALGHDRSDSAFPRRGGGRVPRPTARGATHRRSVPRIRSCRELPCRMGATAWRRSPGRDRYGRCAIGSSSDLRRLSTPHRGGASTCPAVLAETPVSTRYTVQGGHAAKHWTCLEHLARNITYVVDAACFTSSSSTFGFNLKNIGGKARLSGARVIKSYSISAMRMTIPDFCLYDV